MSSKTKNHIYIYDSDNHQIIIIDGETGEEIEVKDDQVASLLNYFNKNQDYSKLRKFSVWCAHQINSTIKPIQAKMFDLAEQAIYDEVGVEQLKKLYKETEGTAIAADTVGLQHGSKNAPAFLASRECINPDAHKGAVQAARYHQLWAEMEEKDENNHSYLKEMEVQTGKNKIEQVKQAQIDHLLDLMK